MVDLGKRGNDFLIYMGLKNYWDNKEQPLQVSDLRWMIEYLEDRLEFYAKQVKKQSVKDMT